jgi:hypothetical protein
MYRDKTHFSVTVIVLATMKIPCISYSNKSHVMVTVKKHMS